MADDNLSRLDAESLWHPLTQHQGIEASPPRFIERGEGCYLYDADGNRFYDAVSGLWCVNVGHGREELAQVAAEQMKKLSYVPGTMSHEPGVRLAAKLVELLGYPARVYYSNSGSEANEAAFKMARQYQVQRTGIETSGGQGRYKIIARHRGYHGCTLGALSATGNWERRHGYEPLVPGFVFTDAPDPYRGVDRCAEKLEETILREGANSVAAFITETIVAGGGLLFPPDDYLPAVREICTKYGVLLIIDEVVTGFGRTGKMFAHQHWGVKPDIITMAKGIASGYMPLAATVASEEVFRAFDGTPASHRHFRHVNTFGGHPVSTAVGLENLAIIEREGLVERVADSGRSLMARLEKLYSHPNVGDVRGKGLLFGIELVADKVSKQPAPADRVAAVLAGCAKRGVIIGRTAETSPGQGNILIMAPPFVSTEAEFELLAASLDESLSEAFSDVAAA